ncbi:hypothetical protein BKA69DRAFT_1070515 [Paraphysoderma sedebokerense]|nr:hypothetical protein BKA69DRAFT_1070515 [Paraphysoderma sedebokerense]
MSEISVSTSSSTPLPSLSRMELDSPSLTPLYQPQTPTQLSSHQPNDNRMTPTSSNTLSLTDIDVTMPEAPSHATITSFSNPLSQVPSNYPPLELSNPSPAFVSHPPITPPSNSSTIAEMTEDSTTNEMILGPDFASEQSYQDEGNTFGVEIAAGNEGDQDRPPEDLEPSNDEVTIDHSTLAESSTQNDSLSQTLPETVNENGEFMNGYDFDFDQETSEEVDDDDGASASEDNDDDLMSSNGMQQDTYYIESDPPEEITAHDVFERGIDPQGIDWDVLPVSRERYRQARIQSYHNYRNLDTQLDSLDSQITPLSSSPPMYQFHYTKLALKHTIVHFQLRNLIYATSKNSVYYTHDHLIKCYNPLTRTSSTLIDCFSDPSATGGFGPVKISTMCADRGVVMIGGFNGEYVLKSLNKTAKPVSGVVTTDPNGITNHIEITEGRGGDIKAIVSSNDQKVRMLNLETRAWKKTIDVDWAVNCTTQSPDRRLLCVVGDDTNSLIVDADRGEVITKLTGHIDYSFACAWSPTSHLLATGNQDNTARLYDTRFLSKTLKVYRSSLGSVRSLRFHPTSTAPFLFMAESADFVHIININEGTKQTIDFFGEIGGITVAQDGEKFWVANSDDVYGSVVEYESVGGRRWWEWDYEMEGDRERRRKVENEGEVEGEQRKEKEWWDTSKVKVGKGWMCV